MRARARCAPRCPGRRNLQRVIFQGPGTKSADDSNCILTMSEWMPWGGRSYLEGAPRHWQMQVCPPKYKYVSPIRHATVGGSTLSVVLCPASPESSDDLLQRTRCACPVIASTLVRCWGIKMGTTSSGG